MFDNIQKFILHVLAENIAQAATLLIGLAFKDGTGLSVFPLAPVQILWVIMITSGMPDMGLGLEEATSGILERPPMPLKVGVFTWEVCFDMLAYGLWMSALCLSSFLLVVYGFGDGDLGEGCNGSYSQQCDTVFRARATTFVSLTWFALFLAWEMVDMRRSFFRMQPDSKRYFTQWMYDVWSNQFLFWSVVAGFVTIFPTLYIPVCVLILRGNVANGLRSSIMMSSSRLESHGSGALSLLKRCCSSPASKHGNGASESFFAVVLGRWATPVTIWSSELMEIS
jgi:P-type Na+/K+ transporter